MTPTTSAATPLAPNDFKSELKPIWCPGCGDFGVVQAIYRALANVGRPPHEIAFISGIGCSSRIPGYTTAYGFNSVHGRALPIAQGIKMANPELLVLVAGGDGDGFSIGGGHVPHAIRRNPDITYIVMDNEIYGLTKGQSAPTTPSGDKTKSTYYGNPEPSFDPCELAISFGATWVARGFSGDLKSLVDLMVAGMSHHGFAFLNVMSPCVTWRGEDQFKSFKAKSRPIPEGHDKTSRAAALQFTRETEIMSLGVLYEVKAPSLIDRLAEIQTRARASRTKEPTTDEIVRSFLPKL